MASKICMSIILSTILSTIADSTDRASQPLDNKSQETQYKEVIMYWTPSQIRAYEQNLHNEESKSQSYDNNFANNNDTSLFHTQETNRDTEFERNTQNQYLYQSQAQQNEHNSYKPTQHIYTPSSGSYQQLSPQVHLSAGPNNQVQNSEQKNTVQEQQRPYLFVDVNQELLQRHLNEQNRQHNDELKTQQQLFYPEADYIKKTNQDNFQDSYELSKDKRVKEPDYEKYQLVPYEYISENQRIHQNLGKQILEQIKPDLLPQQYQKSIVTQQNNFDQQQYSNQKYAYDVETLLNEIRLEKLQAQAKAEAIAQSPPVVVHRDISIVRRRPTHIIKTVTVPVPAPFLVPIPQPYEVKVPQPYPVPLAIIRPYAVPIVKTEKIEVEKPVPVEVEKLVPVPVEKKVYVKVDKPYTVERIVAVPVHKAVPVEVPVFRPEKLTIVRHVWTR